MHPVYVFCNYALYNIWPIFPAHKTCILCQTLIVPNSKAMFNSHVLNVGNRNVHPSFSFQCMGDRLLGFWENEWKVKIILLYFSQNQDFVLNFLPPYIYSEFIRSHLVLHKTWRLIKGNLLWNNVKYRLGHISSKLHRDSIQSFFSWFCAKLWGFRFSCRVVSISKMYNSGKTNFKKLSSYLLKILDNI